MKKYCLLLLLSACYCFVFGQDSKNCFRELTFEQALEKAKEENKLVFIDCYIQQCAPCKVMDQEVFVLDSVINYLSSTFVCVKYDLEKGRGSELAKRYQVQSFPTYLLLLPDGNEIGRIIGQTSSAEFMSKLRNAIREENNLSTLRVRFEQGALDKQGMIHYLNLLIQSKQLVMADTVYRVVFPTLTEEEKINAELWSVYSSYNFTPLGSENLNFVLTHKKDFEKVIDKGVIDQYFYNLYFNVVQWYIGGEQLDENGNSKLPDLKELMMQVKMLNLEGDQKNLSLWLKMAELRVREDYLGMITCTREILKGSLQNQEIWALATFYLTKEIKDTAVLKELEKLEDEFIQKLTDEKIHPFIKGSFGKDRTRPAGN